MMKKTALVMCLVLGGCVGGPAVKLNNVSEGHWRGKALVKDKEQGRSYVVNLNFNAVRHERARMDVTSTLGTGVASLMVEPKEVRYVLFDSKRFYYGNPQVDVMRPILALPFDPRWLNNLLFEDPVTDKGWSCEVDSGGFLQSCRDTISNTKITWSSRQGEKRTVMIEHPKASVQINVNSFKPKVEDRKNLFVLEAPEGYQKLRVR
ncbi:MAG: hypothetical protein KF799_01545 [Bdellovibrionales bacterium]|nr:hypothetical protein [Bdellovibrionales bacterium]